MILCLLEPLEVCIVALYPFLQSLIVLTNSVALSNYLQAAPASSEFVDDPVPVSDWIPGWL